MKTSLNGAGLNAGGLDLFGFADLAARHGFDGIDFGIGGAMKAGDDPMAVRDRLAEKNVAPATFGLDVEWRKDEDAFASGLAALPAKAAFAHALGCDRCVTWMPPSVNADLADWEAQTVRRFRDIARVLGDKGVRFGLEWVGPHHLRANGANAMGANAWIHTLGGTLALIEQIAETNVGLLVDCYHCYTTGVGNGELEKLLDSQIVHVHLNDAKNVPVEDVRDGDRVLPGEGVIDLEGFLAALRLSGYSGYAAVEVLSPNPIAGDADTAAARVRDSLRRIGL